MAFPWPTKSWMATRRIAPRCEVSQAHRRPIWPSQAHLGNGSWHSHRRGSGRDAVVRSTHVVFGGHSEKQISEHEKHWLDLPWQKVRDSVDVKLYTHEKELYVLAKSEGRQQKEMAMRRRRL